VARGAATRGKRAKPDARREPQQRSRRSARIEEQTLFFPRLRRQAKWVFVFLALVFAVGFVAFGVGSGSTGIGDILRGNFFGGGGGSSQIKADEKRIASNPKDVSAYLDLSGIYQQKADETNAVATLQRALKVAPQNLDVLNRLAGIYRGQAESARLVAQDAQILYADNSVTPPGLDLGSTLGQALGSDPYTDTLKTKANEAYSKMVTSFSQAEGAYKKVAAAAKGTSQEANSQLQLGVAAELSGDTTTAISAYARYLKIAPDSPNASVVRQSLLRLQASLPKSHR
jgi:tetratricopeptide (TPR) repeat protein